jgi:hypothetical protein
VQRTKPTEEYEQVKRTEQDHDQTTGPADPGNYPGAQAATAQTSAAGRIDARAVCRQPSSTAGVWLEPCEINL